MNEKQFCEKINGSIDFDELVLVRSEASWMGLESGKSEGFLAIIDHVPGIVYVLLHFKQKKSAESCAECTKIKMKNAVFFHNIPTVNSISSLLFLVYVF